MHFSDSNHPRASLQEKLETLFTFRGGVTADLTIRPDLYSLLARLGNPHETLPPTIHVAGTNGKGSVLALLEAVFKAEGYTVHKYTSPHLQIFNERIVLANEMIGDEALESLLDEVLAATQDLSLTFFEITTAMAFLAFSRIPADVLLLETGLGGRLDCTNVITKPLVTVITPIGMDHREFLGETLEEIAQEKAGIMKPGVICVTAPQDEPVMRVLERAAHEQNCPLQAFGEAWRIDEQGGRLRFLGIGHDVTLPYPALEGAHQIMNAGVVLAVLFSQNHFKVSKESLIRGFENVVWPGRLQNVPAEKVGLPATWQLYLDGGHNEQAGQALAVQFKHWKEERPDRPLYLILGMMKSKDPQAYTAPLRPYLDGVVTVPISGEQNAFESAALAACLAGCGIKVESADCLEEGVAMVAGYAEDFSFKGSEMAFVLLGGSFYLVGRALALIERSSPSFVQKS